MCIKNVRNDNLICKVYETREEMGKAAAKERLKIEWYEHDSGLIAHFRGYNKKYEEEIDFKLTIGSQGYSIEVVPFICFDYLEHFPKFKEYKIDRIEKKYARFSVKGRTMNVDEIIEKLHFLFSVDVLLTYQIMVTQDLQISKYMDFDM